MTIQPYLALIGDVVASREREDRERLQARMIAAIDAVNGDLGTSALAAPLTLTAGDEIQGLLRDPGAAVPALQELTDRTAGTGRFPHLVFGLGFGPLSTGTLPAAPAQALNPALLDGPCFHLARQALAEASRAHVWVRWQGLEPGATQALDALFDLMGALRSSWTLNQAVNTYQVRRFVHQKDWALEQGVNPSVISESLKAAHYEAIRSGEAAARSLLAVEPGKRPVEGPPEERRRKSVSFDVLRTESSGLAVLALLFAGHFLADFVFQSRALLEGKRTSRRMLWLHGAQVLAVQACTLLPFAFDRGRGLVAVLVVAGAHVPIDRAKAWVEAKRGTRLLWFSLEQLLHAAVILGTVTLWSSWMDPFALGPLSLEPALLASAAWIVAAYAFAVNGGSAVVTAVLESLRRESPASPATSGRPGTPGAGRLIGILERLILVTLVWQGEWGAIGFVLAAKSVARFKELEERAFAEVYLVGTLTSFLVAGALGLFLRTAL